jgi:hypothetical protein
MLRDEVVNVMTEVINNMNREMGAQHNVPSDVLEQQIITQKEQLNYVNGLLYDTLLEYGIINTNR